MVLASSSTDASAVLGCTSLTVEAVASCADDVRSTSLRLAKSVPPLASALPLASGGPLTDTRGRCSAEYQQHMRELRDGHLWEAGCGGKKLAFDGGAHELGEEYAADGRVQVFVRNLRGVSLTCRVRPSSDDVSVLRAELQRREGVAAADQRLVFGGKQLEDGRPLAEYGIAKEATISLALRLRGGGRAIVLPKCVPRPCTDTRLQLASGDAQPRAERTPHAPFALPSVAT